MINNMWAGSQQENRHAVAAWCMGNLFLPYFLLLSSFGKKRHWGNLAQAPGLNKNP